MLFKEMTALYSEHHLKHRSTLFGQIAEIMYVKADGIFSSHYALRGSISLLSSLFLETSEK
jgi:hypothetical protein